MSDTHTFTTPSIYSGPADDASISQGQMDQQFMKFAHTLPCDIRGWTKAQRQQLKKGGFVTLKFVNNMEVKILRFGLMATSAKFRTHILQHPNDNTIDMLAQYIELRAIRAIAAWLVHVCDVTRGYRIQMPHTLAMSLPIRYAALQLGLDKYVHHFQGTYKKMFYDCVPSKEDARLVVKYAFGEDDQVVVALGKQLAYFQHSGVIKGCLEVNFKNFLASPKNAELAKAVNGASG